VLRRRGGTGDDAAETIQAFGAPAGCVGHRTGRSPDRHVEVEASVRGLTTSSTRARPRNPGTPPPTATSGSSACPTPEQTPSPNQTCRLAGVSRATCGSGSDPSPLLASCASPAKDIVLRRTRVPRRRDVFGVVQRRVSGNVPALLGYPVPIRHHHCYQLLFVGEKSERARRLIFRPSLTHWIRQ